METLQELLPFNQATAFLVVFAVGFVFTVLSFLLGELFDGLDDLLGGAFDFFDIELDVAGAEGKPGVFRSLVSGLTLFGAAGWVSTLKGLGALASSGIGAGCGIAGAAATLVLLGFILRQQASSTIDPDSVTGAVGTLTIAIPEGGRGKAVLMVAGARVTRPARSNDGGAIPHNSRVEVVATEGGTVIVRQL